MRPCDSSVDEPTIVVSPLFCSTASMISSMTSMGDVRWFVQSVGSRWPSLVDACRHREVVLDDEQLDAALLRSGEISSTPVRTSSRIDWSRSMSRRCRRVDGSSTDDGADECWAAG